MGRPSKLIDDIERTETEAAFDEDCCIAGEGDRIARDGRDVLDCGSGDFTHLPFSTCAGWIDHHA